MATGQDFLNMAKSVSRGHSYEMGAAGPLKFDCSGLVMYTAKKFGIDLPKYSGTQFEKLPKISEKNAKTGDLVFFGDRGKSHVGIVSGKSGMFYSARASWAKPNIGMAPIHNFGEPVSGFARIPQLKQASSRGAKTAKGKKGKYKKGKIYHTKRVLVTSESAKSIAKYGRLTKIETAKDKMNPGQMKVRSKQLLKRLNKQQKTLKVTTTGHTDFQAGNSCWLKIQDLKDIGVGTQQVLIKSADHHYGEDYTVDLELII